MSNGPLINPEAAAQLASLSPEIETVETWRRFRVLVGALSTGEAVLEFRKIDGTRVVQFVLDDEARQTTIDGLVATLPSDQRIVVP